MCFRNDVFVRPGTLRCPCNPDGSVHSVRLRHHNRPPPDKTKDKEGVSLSRTPLNQRSRGVAPPPPPPEQSDEEEEEEEEEVKEQTQG